MRKLFFITWFPLLVMLLTGCVNLKPAPIAEGSDPVVVNAERAQKSSLDVFRIVTKWEYDNRITLPKEVSRIVDTYREEFPPAWKESRLALVRYKELRGTDADTMSRITAALLTTQEALLKLKQNASTNEVTQVQSALSRLLAAIRTVAKPTPAPAPVLAPASIPAVPAPVR